MLSIYHIMLLAICTAQVEKRVQKKKKRVTKNLLQGIRTRTLQTGLKMNMSIHCTMHLSRRWQLKLKRGIYSFLMVIDRFKDDFFGFHVELNLKLIEVRRKSHNKPITTLSGLVYAAERLRNLWTVDLAATDWTLWPYDSLLARKVSFHRSGKTVTTLFIIISSFRLE